MNRHLYRVTDLYHNADVFTSDDEAEVAAVVLAFTACGLDGRSAFGAVCEARDTGGPVRVGASDQRRATRSVVVRAKAASDG